MAQTWQNTYEELKKFIAAHPAIEIDMSSVVISGDIRPDFYRLFDTVRAGFIKERFAAELEKAYALSAAWGKASEEIKEEMGLEDIEINASLNWFLLDPINGLMRVLFDTLFDLLKGKTDFEGFIAVSDAAVSESFKALFREGYERWGALALLRLLAPTRLWVGKTHDFYTDPTMEGDVIEGNRDDFALDPVESKKLIFDNLVRASFVVPGALVQSGRLNAYVSLRPRWYLPRWKARMWNERLEWLDTKKLYRDFGTGNLWPDMMIHVADERPEDLKMIADFYRIARPEIILEFMEEDDWYDAKRVEDIMRHNVVLNPRLGSYVISRVDVPPEAFRPLEALPLAVPVTPSGETGAIPPASETVSAPVTATLDSSGTPAVPAETSTPPPPPMARPLSLAELPEGVHVISAGYDMSKLEPVVAALMQATALIKETRMKELEPGQNQV